MDYMLWYDGSTAPVADRVSRAATFYEEKYGRRPTRCLVPKGTDATGLTGLTCVEDQYVLPNHLMIGGDA